MKKNGFTLVEILIALLILTISIGPGMQMIAFTIKVNRMNQQTYRNHKQMQEVMETIKTLKSIDHDLVVQLNEGVKIQVKNVDQNYDLYQLNVYMEETDTYYLSSYLLGETAYSLLNTRYEELPVNLD